MKDLAFELSMLFAALCGALLFVMFAAIVWPIVAISKWWYK